MLAYLKLAAVGVVLAGAFGAGFAVNGWRLGSTISKMEAEAFRMAAEARATESRWAEHVIKIGEDANAEAETLRAALARADAARGSLHDARERRASEASAAAGAGSTAAATVLLLAELHRELDEFAGEAARAADAARASGLVCIRADEVTR